MVWKDLDSKYPNKVKKKYLGKSKDRDMNVENILHNLSHKKRCKEIGLIDKEFTMTKLNKVTAIVEAAENGNELAQEYIQKIDDGKVLIDWAYKKVFKLNQTEKITTTGVLTYMSKNNSPALSLSTRSIQSLVL